ncbi:MAG TPA: DUF6265 family protein [Gemmatimonadaceae bacterium]|nr:DUF6265 family protein [Gemmatimonadaceae bacterium]
MRFRAMSRNALMSAGALLLSGHIIADPKDAIPAGEQHPALNDVAAPAELTDLEWLAGAWTLEQPGERLDEHWSPPAANSMVGHFRWISSGQLRLTELLTITEEAGEVVFRLRHFSARMRPWEAQDDPFTYRLSGRSHSHAVFSSTEVRTGRPHRFIYRALPGDSLLVRLEGDSAGRPTIQEYRFGKSTAP